MAFIKSFSRLFGGSGKHEPTANLAAFGKHPGWNDHLDDLGLDTEALVNAKRLLYIQGISQNIDAGAWEALEPTDPGAPISNIARLDAFRHDFLWSMGPSLLLTGRLWSSSDGKGRDKYPMVLCAQLTDVPASFATTFVLPFLSRLHEKCAAAKTSSSVNRLIVAETDTLRGMLHDPMEHHSLTGRELAAISKHRDMGDNPQGPAGGGGGFHRIVYQFARGMSPYHQPPLKNAPPRRPEQVRLPNCGMSPRDALHFWHAFALTFLDPSTPLLLFAPDQGARAPWVDLIVGEPSPANIFCIKAGTKSLPFTSDIPYTLDPSLRLAIDSHIAQCAALPDSAPLPPWPMIQ